MRAPGFTAEQSVGTRARHYVASMRATQETEVRRISAQQDSDCCHTHCSGACYCQHGAGHCIPFTEDASGSRRAPVFLKR
jgi:hypothetical protein